MSDELPPDGRPLGDAPRTQRGAPKLPDHKPGEGRKRGDDSGWGYVGVGLQMLVGTALGFLVGNWLDKRYGWAPWGVLGCTMLGLAAGMYLLIKDALRMNKD